MAKRTRLLSPYPGAKNPDRYPVYDGGDYDAWVVPFAGSGEQESWLARAHPSTPVVAADSDFLVRVVWHCWGKSYLRRAVVDLVESWQKRIALDPEGAFAELAHHANWYHDPAHQQGYNPVLVATVSILLRRLTFGGVIRFNSEGKFNVKLSQDKLEKFLAGWSFTWPEPPPRLKMFDDWSCVIDWSGVADRIAGHDPDPLWNFNNAIALVDPPYCAGTTDAYAQSHGDLDMAVDCIQGLLASARVSRLVAFNYWGEWAEGNDSATRYPIMEAMQQLAYQYATELHFSRLGTLTTMNKGVKDVGDRRLYKVHRFEGVWEFGGKRLYGSRPVVKPSVEVRQQLSLLDL